MSTRSGVFFFLGSMFGVIVLAAFIGLGGHSESRLDVAATKADHGRMQHLLDRLTELAKNLRAGIAPTSGDAVVLDTAAMRLDCLNGMLMEIAHLDPTDTAMSKREYRGTVREIASSRLNPIPGFPD